MPEHNADEPDVSVMIVAYNSAALIETCIASIPPACSAYDYEILLVDNGDGSTEELVAREFPDVRIVPSRGNIGFAGGNNLLAASASGRNLLLLNPDVELKAGAVDALLTAARRLPDAAAWGGVTLDRKGQPDLGNDVHAPSLGEMASRTIGRSSARSSGALDFDEDRQVAMLSGSFVMVSRSAWDEVGGLDSSYFLYCEEVDLFYRLAKKGHTFWRISDARAFHDIGHGDVYSPGRELYLVAGNMHFARLHWSKPKQWLASVLTWLGSAVRFLIGALFGRWNARLAMLGERHRLVACHPNDWRRGYDPQRGLMTRPKRAGKPQE